MLCYTACGCCAKPRPIVIGGFCQNIFSNNVKIGTDLTVEALVPRLAVTLVAANSVFALSTICTG